jgi:hypothetical protein
LVAVALGDANPDNVFLAGIVRPAANPRRDMIQVMRASFINGLDMQRGTNACFRGSRLGVRSLPK